RLVQVDKPAGDDDKRAVEHTTYDALGRMVASTDALGNVNRLSYDNGGNLIGERHADGGEVSHTYNAYGERLSTSTNGNRTEFRYDNMSRLRQVIHPQVRRVWTSEDENLRVIADGSVPLTETFGYDELGRRTSVRNGNDEVTQYAYDLRGNVVRTMVAGVVTSQSLYDSRNRKIAEVDANKNSTLWEYSYFGRLIDHSDLGGARYTYTYDGLGQLKRRIDDHAVHKVSVYAYDLAGNRLLEQVWQADPGTPTLGLTYQENLMAYDAANRLRLVTGLAGARIEYTYDANGNRIHQWGRFHTGGVSGEEGEGPRFDYWSAYDAMNRQVVAEGVLGTAATGVPGVQREYGYVTI
ncbi:RHS repeat protein, partial [Pseudorivibacter rhizosphaerae]|uniref:RHS repeat protein n=1 Tax=Methylibium rhizosphaerae TaxID=2570323 RepID=UPI0011279D5A